MSVWSAWGSWERERTTGEPVYMVSARCDPGCHSLFHRFSAIEIELARYPAVMIDVVGERIAREFARLEHPVTPGRNPPIPTKSLRPPKGHQAQRMRPNQKPPTGPAARELDRGFLNHLAQED